MANKAAIIVLSHNGLDVTKKFLKHLYRYTDDFTLIMIDNGSSDESPEYLGEFSDDHDNMLFIANDENLGVIGGRNHGWSIYQTLDDKPPYLGFLDNDQFVEDGWLDQHLNVLDQSHAHVVGVEAWMLSTTFRPMHRCKRFGEPWSYVGCGGMFMKKEVPEDISMFDPQFNPCYFEDPDFCFRARRAGYRLAWNYKARVTHLPHQTLGKNPKRMQLFQKSHAKFFEKWKGSRFTPQRQHAVEALQ